MTLAHHESVAVGAAAAALLDGAALEQLARVRQLPERAAAVQQLQQRRLEDDGVVVGLGSAQMITIQKLFEQLFGSSECRLWRLATGQVLWRLVTGQVARM